MELLPQAAQSLLTLRKDLNPKLLSKNLQIRNAIPNFTK